MNAQQLHDHIIKPVLQYMGGNYYSEDAAFLLLATAAIESDCGYYIKQINGPALGIWQMEPTTHNDIWQNCDALKGGIENEVYHLTDDVQSVSDSDNMIFNPKYACAMARLKYSMDRAPLPKVVCNSICGDKLKEFYDYYKRIYNTELGASTFDKWCAAIVKHKILKVKL